MTAGILIWCIVLAFLGLNTALVAWLLLRLSAGPFYALIGFNVMLFATCWGIIQLVG